MSSLPNYGRRQARGGQLWAEPLAPVSGNGHMAPYRGQTYYDRPAIKPSHYRWLITGYLFSGGIAGASQIIATVADLFGGREHRGAVRAGRYVALAAAMASPVCLILDLHTPKRWYNMMRIFRPTSPMSIGSWTLAGFGTFTGVAALGQLISDLTGGVLGRGLARFGGVPAAAGGMVMSCYTGSLLSATSVPFWAAVHRLLPPLFGTSAMSTGAAATSIALDATGASEAAHKGLERIALAASATELVLTLACDKEWKAQHVDSPIEHRPDMARAYKIGVLGFGILVPLVIHAVQVLTGRRSKVATKVADASALAGGFVQRAVMTFGGNDSAERPRDYFRFAQPAANGRGVAA
ncbi:MAG TPA: NrfD/PsrC family molybdoenzyme membrane anchor subunit [Chloroflexota bacterium]|nr:NrfD/PsrC family molybdoenzyme membrane anchor subunit [Chloroflexota bacterium]